MPGKRINAMKERVVKGKAYALSEAVAFLKESTVKFDETVELCVILGVDPRKSDQVVRGAVALPHGSGKTIRIAVFAQGESAEEARSAGADVVGLEDLIEQVKKGDVNFDRVVATPDAMRLLASVGQILGPRGLMPNPKDGTVTKDVKKAVQHIKAGQASYRADKAGIVHCGVGKLSFSADYLVNNVKAVLSALKKAKPVSAKGVYMKKITLSSTMGPGLLIDITALDI